MSRADLDTLRERARKGEIDRTSLIKALRKVRMQAVNESDREVLDALQDPPEVVENYMEVWYGEQVFVPCLKPLLLSEELALRTVPVSA